MPSHEPPRHSPPSDDDPLIGVQLGNYKVEEKVAEGGMGLIYRAVHSVIGRQAAIKVLTERYSNDQNMIKRLHREARAVNRIAHPSIVDIFDFGQTPDGRQYFAMEYIEGESLALLLEREGALPWAVAGQIVSQALDALAAAHDLGIVHRDIKPENILIAKGEGEKVIAKVLDFGIAKSIGIGPEGEQLTRAGSVMGTPEYIAPEQVRGKSVDGRADLYAMGVILYEMVVGKRPYTSDKVMTLLIAHLREPIPAVENVPAELGIPKEVIEAIPKALAKKPEERFQDARSFARAMGMATSAVTAADGTRPLPGLFWAGQEGSTSTLDNMPASTAATAPKHPPTILGLATRTSSNGMAMPLIDKPRRSPLMWLAPLLLLGLSAAAISYVVVTRAGDNKKVVVTKTDTRPKTSPKTVMAPLAAKDLATLLHKVRQTLREGLESSDTNVRRCALRGLGELHDKDARLKLVKRLKVDPDPTVQADAARALALLGEPQAAADLKAVRDEVNEQVRVKIDAALAKMSDPAGIKGLKAALKSPKRAVRVTAALELAELGDTTAIAVLKPELRGASQLFTPTLKALARLGHAQARKSLEQGIAAKETKTKAQLEFAEALMALGSEIPLSLLKRIVNSDGSLAHRLTATRILARHGNYAGLDLARDAVRNEAAALRLLAANALGTIADRTAIPPLALLLADKLPLVKMAAAEGLARVFALLPETLLRRGQNWLLVALNSEDWASRYAIDGLSSEIDPALAVEILGWYFRSKDARTRAVAVAEAAKLGENAKARQIVFSGLDDPAPGVRLAAVRALGRSKHPKAASMLKQLLYDKTPRVGIAAGGALLRLGDTSALKALRQATRAKKSTLRARALEAIAQHQAPWVVKTLRRALRDRSPEVRRLAALALASRNDSSGAKVLRKAVAAGDEHSANALRALAKLKIPQQKNLRLLAQAANPRARAGAMKAAIEILGPSRAQPLLLRGARDPSPVVRLAAARELGKLAKHSPAAIASLRRLVKDQNASVRAVASNQLAKLRAAGVRVKPVKISPTPKAPALPVKPKPKAGKKGTTSTELSFLRDSSKHASYKSLIASAQLLYERGRLGQALATLQRARRINNTPPVNFEMGLVHLKLAIRRLRSPRQRAQVLSHLDAAKRYYTAYLRRAPRGKLVGRARGGLRDVKRLKTNLR
ncbi:MAG: HEAT repeat domain-containing protein [Deltaproteobacteria bacterium]|nr:HEAT repeat domain-containing protein [Deltaproteobacteria bacterium]